ncbi:hypothetical protein BKA70DRAFT_1237013 [Coprinopsis sp. MPI-PUGE-AT-0042]|nr:hypothetical protein BKA70DRAFT_1237013 [Coprinopsis sp. MPI-PUGE-AT-0042]
MQFKLASLLIAVSVAAGTASVKPPTVKALSTMRPRNRAALARAQPSLAPPEPVLPTQESIPELITKCLSFNANSLFVTRECPNDQFSQHILSRKEDGIPCIGAKEIIAITNAADGQACAKFVENRVDAG